MPTVLRVGPYRFFFFSNEGNEPPHVHVESGDGYAKYWLKPPTLARSMGFRSHSLAEIRAIIEENEQLILEKWIEYFGKA